MNQRFRTVLVRDRRAADQAVSENQKRAHLQTKQVPSASGRQISPCWNVGTDPDDASVGMWALTPMMLLVMASLHTRLRAKFVIP